MSRSIDEAAHTAAAALLSQLTSHAFTLHGFAIEDNWVGKEQYQCIWAQPKTSDTYEKGSTNHKDGTGNWGSTTLHREAARFAGQEAQEEKPHPDAVRYLVVGYALRAIDDALTKSNKEGKDPNKANRSAQKAPYGSVPLFNTFSWDDNAPPTIVVTPLLEKRPPKLETFALIYPHLDTGLCKLHAIAKEVVFFRAEFRTSVSSFKDRKPEWSELCLARIVRDYVPPSGTTKLISRIGEVATVQVAPCPPSVNGEKTVTHEQMVNKMNDFQSAWSAAGEELKEIAGGDVPETSNTTTLEANITQHHRTNVAAYGQILQQVVGRFEELKEMASKLPPKP